MKKLSSILTILLTLNITALCACSSEVTTDSVQWTTREGTVSVTSEGDSGTAASQSSEPDATAASSEDSSSADDSSSGKSNSKKKKKKEQEDAAEQASSIEEPKGDTAVAENAETTAVDENELTEPEIETSYEVTQPVRWDDGNLNVVFMGDSQFASGWLDGTDIATYTGKLVEFEDTAIYNLAIGGNAASVTRGDNDSPDMQETCFVSLCHALSGKSDTEFLAGYPSVREQINVIDPEYVDYYVIEYGANDYLNGKDLGNWETRNDSHTYFGALSQGISELRSVSPDAVFILCGPSYCVWYRGNSSFVIGDAYTVTKGMATLSQYAQTCENVADSEGCYYIDTMFRSYFNLYMDTIDEYLIDGLHYTEKGRQIYATVVAHFINKDLGYDLEPQEYLKIDEFTFQ